MDFPGLDTESLDSQTLVPKLKDFFQVVLTAPSSCQIRYGNDMVFAFEGNDVQNLLFILGSLDGKKTMKIIKAELEKCLSIPQEVSENLIVTLLRKGIIEDNCIGDYITDDQADRFANELAFLSKYSVNKYGYFSVLKEKKIGVLGFSEVSRAAVKALASLGVGSISILRTSKETDGEFGTSIQKEVKEFLGDHAPYVSLSFVEAAEGSSEDLIDFINNNRFDVLIVPLHYFENIEAYEVINDRCVSSKTPFVSGYAQGDNLEIGPFVIPGATACYYCYNTRRKSNLEKFEYLKSFEEGYTQRPERSIRRGEPSIFCSILGEILAWEVYKYLLGFEQPATFDTLLQFNLMSLELTKHHIFKLPRCPKCSKAGSKPMKSLWTLPFESLNQP